MKTAFNPHAITRSALQQLRHATDPLADQVVKSIIESGQEKQINQILSTLIRSDSFHPGMFAAFGVEVSSLLEHYLEQSHTLPTWADDKLIRQGEKMFASYGPMIFMLLNVSSLPMCYCCANGARVLFDTGRLLTHDGSVDPLARRLMETAQMIVNVHAPGGLSAKGRGVITIQKVRLIHASIRYFLKHKQAGDPWNVDQLGEPINQEDLAGTLMSFGPVILSGLMKLGIALSEEEASAWMHCWNIAGYLLGIEESLLPDSYDQGCNLATEILNHQATPSPEGVALTESCIRFINSIIPGNAFNEVPAYLMWYFLQDFSKESGKNLAACIGVSGKEHLKDKFVFELSMFASKELGKIESHNGFVARIVRHFNRLMLQGMIYHFNDGKRVQFFIPPSLQANWDLMDVWNDHLSSPSVLGNRISWQKKNEILKDQKL